MEQISKSRFKAKALEYLRRVEKNGEAIVITDRGRPVARVTPYTAPDPRAALDELRGSVLEFEAPTDPVGLEDWELLDDDAT